MGAKGEKKLPCQVLMQHTRHSAEVLPILTQSSAALLAGWFRGWPGWLRDVDPCVVVDDGDVIIVLKGTSRI